MQAVLCTGLEQVQYLSTEPHHQRLAFRITKAHVVFDKSWLPVLDHQADKQDAFKWRAALAHLVHARFDDFIHRLLGHAFGHHGGRGIGPHAAGVWPCVALTYAFMVLGGANGQNVGSVAQHKERCLFAIHEFFDHDFRACVPE